MNKRLFLMIFGVWVAAAGSIPGQDKAPTAKGMKGLATAKQLTWLSLTSTYLTDDGLAEIATMSQLDTLDIESNKKVTDKGLQQLAALKNLRNLFLGNTGVTEDGLAHLAAFPKLEGLSLAGLKITDAGIKHLIALKHLQGVYLGQTQVSAKGRAELLKAKPKLRVTW